MVVSDSLQEIQDYINQNDMKIQYLHEINSTLKEEYDLQSNYESLSQKFKFLQKEEQEQVEKLNQSRKKYLMDLELKGTELCKEHAKLLHQIEHLQWHFEKGSSKHEQCHAAVMHSCKSSATSLNRSSLNKSFDTANLENTSERLIKAIAELRRRIHNAKEKLDKEIHRKRCVEKNLAELRKDISRQKKLISSKRVTPIPSLPAIRKSACAQ
ncbi:uncharacterized protein LOC119070064 [Bradysia coprophila]|uniref:uncharacterized protein LOC119070064 n=1 Tax=Bradysia coprophila TaxID=38358 RepID=UPI00187DDA04|nr:uncharacterized protein LOC119070064 [Bradysia coprophila]